MDKKVQVFGVPLDLGAKKLGVDMGPTSIRYASLEQALRYNGILFKDGGDLIVDKSLISDFSGDDQIIDISAGNDFTS